MKLPRRTFLAQTAALMAVAPVAKVMADAHEGMKVQMLTRHPEDKKLRNVFLPRILVVQPGDTVLFEATDKTHNSASIKDMVPAGAEEWKGKVNKDIEVTFEQPGFYGYQCVPHYSLGMVGLVIVQGDGMMDNLEDAKAVRQRGKARAAFEEIWEEVAGMDLTA